MSRRPAVSLAELLRRGHRRATLWAVLIAGMAASAASFAVLREQVAHSLNLLARTVAYNVEAAVAFRDPEAAREIIDALVRREPVAAIEIRLDDGAPFVRSTSPEAEPLRDVLRAAVAVVVPLDATATLSRQQTVLGRVHVQGDGSQFATLLMFNVLGAVAAVLLTAAVSGAVSRALEGQILQPIDVLRRFTRAVRQKRSFALRAPGAGLEEVDGLGDDFNALLEEVQKREGRLLRRHEQLKRRHDDLAHMALYDALTGLANRAHFERRLDDALRRTRPDTRFAVLFIDADDLKATNDRLGHAAGDRLLIELAARLRRVVRAEDCVARVGGDEFAVLVETLRFAEHAMLLERKIQYAMNAPDDGDEGTPAPRVSVGSAVYPEHGLTAPALMRHADEQMYEAKRRKRRAGSAL